MPETADDNLFRIGDNCWRYELTQRVAIAIEGDNYFRAIREAIIAARHRGVPHPT